METTGTETALTPAQHRLILDHMQWACKLVADLARRYERLLPPAEVGQVAHEGLARAARAYRPNLGIPFSGFALKHVRGAVNKAARVERRFYDPLFITAEHWTADGDPFDETDESARDELHARAGEAATAMLFAIIGSRSHALSSGGEGQAIEDLLSSRVRDALAKVPARPRQVIERRHLQGQEIADVAEQMGISTITVRRDYQKGMRRLRQLLGGDDGPDDPAE
jgi:RNA polymerase sigma factor FliA